MKKLCFRKPILLTNSPVMAEVIGKLGESVSVYYCFDDYRSFKDSLVSMQEIESEVLQKVDLAFFTSKKLFDERPFKPARSFLTSQGVNVEHYMSFSQKLVRPLDKVGSPIIGFMGLIESENWIDLGLLIEVSKARPEWNFVFVGPSYLDMEIVKNCKNLHFIGPVPYPDLPPYVWSFDVGIIPFLLNDLTLACNPIKLMEYFLTGIPVVSTAIPEVARFEPLVSIASNSSEFGSAIATALSSKDTMHRQARMGIARKYSWLNIVEQQSDRILSAEAEKEGHLPDHRDGKLFATNH